MAFKNETVTSITDLFTKLNTWMGLNGWTAERLDTSTAPNTGGEWAMRRTAGATNLRIAASWDGANTPDHVGLYQYVDQNWNAAQRPWEQHNDSGNGFAGTLDADIDDSRYVRIGTSPIQYWAFEGVGENDSHYTYIVVEVADGEYVHFGFGLLDKRGGNWTGGEFCYGQKDSGTTGGAQAVRDDRSLLLDGLSNDTPDTGGIINGMELFCATIHAEGMPNQVANGQWGVCMGGKLSSPQTDFGQDRQSNDGSSSDTDRCLFTWGLRAGPYANAFYRAGGEDLTGELRFWPVATTYFEGGNIHGCPIGYMPNVYGCNIKNYGAEQIIVDDAGNTFYIFPAEKKWPGTGAETGTSGYLGIAYRIPSFASLPTSVNDPTGWWSTRDSDDYTLSGSEITVLNDKSGNGNNFTVPGGKTGPDAVTIDGRVWADFPVSGGRVMSGTNTDVDPDSGDFTYIAVYRAVDSGTGPGAIFGKKDGANPNYGIFVGVSNSRSLYFQCRDTVLTNTGIVEHDDVGTDYTDGTSRMVCVTYDDSADDLYLYGGDNDWAASVDSDLAYSSVAITPAVDLYFGDWSNSYDRRHEGEIAELICYNRVLTDSQRATIISHLKDKWGL